MSHPWMPFYVADYLADTGHLSTAEHGAYDTTEVSGWRICNGKTIGSATSGASYANDNAQALFEYLWNKDADLAIIGGRGVSAAADWAANKRLTLPDYRGYALVGRDGMGNSAANRIAALVDLSDRAGAASVALTAGQLPVITPTFTGTPVAAHKHADLVVAGSQSDNGDPGGQVVTAPGGYYGERTILNSETGLAGGHTPAGTISSFGNNEAHSNVQPSAGITVYIKL